MTMVTPLVTMTTSFLVVPTLLSACAKTRAPRLYESFVASVTHAWLDSETAK
jgi:hypothetical protein